MAKIRVLQVFTIMDRGGSESMIMNYYRTIDRSKIQFDFLVHRKEKGIFENEIELLGGKVYRLQAINPLFPKKYYTELRSFFKEHTEYRIVHSHLNTFSSYPLKIAKEFDIPCRIAHAHIAMSNLGIKSLFNRNESFGDIIKQLIKLQLKKKIHHFTTHHFSCGIKAGKWLFDDDIEFTTMNNAIDTEKFKFNPTISKKIRKEFGLQDEIVIGHVGRFDSQKNHGYLLKIFAAVLKLRPNYKLFLIGDGPLAPTLKQLSKSLSIDANVSFLGVRSDVPKLYQMMDIFVFPSLYEGLPVTLIEAQAAGVQVLASDTITKEVQLTDLIEFLDITESPEYWAKKIIDIDISIKKDTKQQIVESEYDIASNAAKIEHFYQQQHLN